MFCQNCGKEIPDNAYVCLGCGKTVSNSNKVNEGNVSAGWWWLGFLIPIAGLLIWIFCNDNEPIKAKKAGMGALIGTIVGVVATVLIYILFFLIGFMLPAFFFSFADYM